MPDRIFVDTNILVYFISDNEKRKHRVRDLLFASENVFVSSQIISEFISVCFSKRLLKADEIASVVNQFLEALTFVPVDEQTIKRALQVKRKYHLAFWDSLAVSSALENNCTVIYTEDMQDGQGIDGTLTIINPFRG